MLPLTCEDMLTTRIVADKHLPGVYAVRLTGSLPDYILEELEGRGITVRSRAQDD